MLSLHVGAGTAKADETFEPGGSNAQDIQAQAVFTIPNSELWFLTKMSQLESSGDARLVYQLGHIGLRFHPQSTLIRIGLIRAAANVGRCAWALSHFRLLDGQPMENIERALVDSITNSCLGGWQHTVSAVGLTGRRKSLVGASQRSSVTVQPGSRVYSLCRLFANLCVDNQIKLRQHGPSSGTDIWLGLNTTSHKTTVDGWHSLSLGMYRRMPTRTGYGGKNVVLRYGYARQHYSNKTLIFTLTGASINQEAGNLRTPTSPDYINFGLAYLWVPGPNRQRFIGMENNIVRRLQTEWRLDHTMVMAGQDSHDLTMARYGLSLPVSNFAIDLSLRLGQKTPANRHPRQKPSSISGSDIGLRGPSQWPLSVRAGVDLETRKYKGILPYLARPHSSRNRAFTLTFGYVMGDRDQLKIGILAKKYKISSENSLSARLGESLTIYFNYEFQKRLKY